MIINYTVQAILELCPGAQLSMDGDEYSNIEWLETERELPSEEEVVKKIIELKYQEEVNEYQRQRADEYPPYADQFDKIYHSGVTAWKTQIKAIKEKYPKQTMDAEELKKRQDKAIEDLNNK